MTAISFALIHLAGIVLLCAIFQATGYLTAPLVRAPKLSPSPTGGFLTRTTLGIIVWIQLLFVLAWVQLYRVGVMLPLAALPLIGAAGRLGFSIRSDPARWRRIGAQLFERVRASRL